MHFRVFSTHHCVVQEVWNFHQNEPRINCIEFENSSSLRMAFGAIDISYVHTVRRMQREMHDDCSIPIPGMSLPPLLLLLPMCIVEIVKINMHELLKWMDALTPPHIHSLYETERWRTSSIVVSLAFIHTQAHNAKISPFNEEWRKAVVISLFSFFSLFICVHLPSLVLAPVHYSLFGYKIVATYHGQQRRTAKNERNAVNTIGTNERNEHTSTACL